MSNKIANISLNLDQKTSYGRVFISEPDKHHEKIAGRLFALIEIEGDRQKAKRITDFIIADLNENYYQNEKLELREIMTAIKVESIFETVLIKTDSRLVEFLVREKIKIDSFSINATVGVLYENELHFATIGHNQALLLYKENDKYQLMPVEKGQDKDSEGKKLFSSIISGDMPAKSFFLFASQALSEYIFNEEILDIITKLSPLSAAEQIKSTLSKINNFASFAGIIIKNSQGQELLTEEVVELPVMPEKNQLSQTETQTEKILGSSASLEKVNTMPLPIDTIKSGAQALANLMKKDDTKVSELRPMDKKKKQIIIAIIIFCVLAMGANVAYLKFKKQKTESQTAANAIAEQISDKLAEVQSVLIYEDKEQAKTIYASIAELMNKLNDKDKESIKDWNSIQEEYTKQGQALAGVQEIKEEKIKSLAETTGNISALEVSGNFGYAAVGQEIIKINLTSGEKETVTLKASGNITSSLYPYFLAGNELLNISKATTTTIENGGQNVIGLSMYLDKLYLYDQTKEELNKLTLKDNKYTEAQSRLKSEAKTIAFAIDLSGAKSDVYLLKADGQIMKFYDGKKQDFNPEVAEPKLSGDNNKLLVKTNIYVLDASNKRIIIYGKDGKFIKQYASASFGDINNFAVDEKGKKIYIVSGNKINKIDIE